MVTDAVVKCKIMSAKPRRSFIIGSSPNLIFAGRDRSPRVPHPRLQPPLSLPAHRPSCGIGRVVTRPRALTACAHGKVESIRGCRGRGVLQTISRPIDGIGLCAKSGREGAASESIRRVADEVAAGARWTRDTQRPAPPAITPPALKLQAPDESN